MVGGGGGLLVAYRLWSIGVGGMVKCGLRHIGRDLQKLSKRTRVGFWYGVENTSSGLQGPGIDVVLWEGTLTRFLRLVVVIITLLLLLLPTLSLVLLLLLLSISPCPGS